MSDRKSVSSWLTFAGWVLVVAVLYWGRAVLMPIALAALLAFVLAGPVTRLQRWVGRTIAVLITVGLVFALLGGALWALGSQLSQLVDGVDAVCVSHALPPSLVLRGVPRSPTVPY
jgi:predicted PurR-regulated permease PerM